MDDLPRIGLEPGDCVYPGCQLLGRYRVWSTPAGDTRITCSLHKDWIGYQRTFTTKDAAEHLGVPEQLIAKWKHRGDVVPVGLASGRGPAAPLYNLEELVPLAARWRAKQKQG